MKTKKKKQPKVKKVERDTFSYLEQSIGPDDRGEYPTVAMSTNSSTAINGLVISGPDHRGTI